MAGCRWPTSASSIASPPAGARSSNRSSVQRILTSTSPCRLATKLARSSRTGRLRRTARSASWPSAPASSPSRIGRSCPWRPATCASVPTRGSRSQATISRSSAASNGGSTSSSAKASASSSTCGRAAGACGSAIPASSASQLSSSSWPGTSHSAWGCAHSSTALASGAVAGTPPATRSSMLRTIACSSMIVPQSIGPARDIARIGLVLVRFDRGAAPAETNLRSRRGTSYARGQQPLARSPR